ncbi:MAG: hypothetical protein WA830_22115 [Candidatus Sulfotelmatobacter sp.]
MKKNFLLFAAALALVVTTVASAQTIKVKVNVPFNFVVNRSTLPAGEYLVQSVDDEGKVLAIRDLDTNTTRLVSFNSCTSPKSASQTKLIFHRYGERYFLNQVWVEGNISGHELSPSPREKEVAKDFSVREVVLMAARH